MNSSDSLLYRNLRSLIQYNRHLIAGYRLNAERLSPYQWRFRIGFIGIALVLGAYVAYAFGEALSEVWPSMDQHWAGLQMLLMVGTGWIIIATIARFSITAWIEYWGHLATTMLVGVFIFFPWQLFHWILAIPLPFTLTVGAVVSFLMMTWLHASRVKLLELPSYWTVLWGCSVLGSLGGWYLCFYG